MKSFDGTADFTHKARTHDPYEDTRTRGSVIRRTVRGKVDRRVEELEAKHGA